MVLNCFSGPGNEQDATWTLFQTSVEVSNSAADQDMKMT